MTPDKPLTCPATDYLSSGGLFNPELADHNAVRDLVAALRDRVAVLEAALKNIHIMAVDAQLRASAQRTILEQISTAAQNALAHKPT